MTKNAINSNNPIEVPKGGTGKDSLTAYLVITSGTTTTGALQQLASIGSDPQVLTSNGASALPTWEQLPTYFEPLGSDPANPAAGTVWYRTDTGDFKCAQVGGGIWTTVTSMSTGRRGAGAAGTGSDCIVYGGVDGGGPTTYTTVNEQWNGTSWSTINSLNTAKANACACGTTSAALMAGGRDLGGVLSSTETWNGTSWSSANSLNTARAELASAGDAASALSFGGTTGSDSAVTESWDGTNWSAVNSLNTARDFLGGGGITASAVSFGGNTSTTTETWDGTNWSSATAMSTARNRLPLSRNGVSTALLAAGGQGLVSGELFNGSTWSAITDLNSISDNGSICGNTNSIMQAGANETSAVSQIYTNADIMTFTVT